MEDIDCTAGIGRYVLLVAITMQVAHEIFLVSVDGYDNVLVLIVTRGDTDGKLVGNKLQPNH